MAPSAARIRDQVRSEGPAGPENAGRSSGVYLREARDRFRRSGGTATETGEGSGSAAGAHKRDIYAARLIEAQELVAPDALRGCWLHLAHAESDLIGVLLEKALLDTTQARQLRRASSLFARVEEDVQTALCLQEHGVSDESLARAMRNQALAGYRCHLEALLDAAAWPSSEARHAASSESPRRRAGLRPRLPVCAQRPHTPALPRPDDEARLIAGRYRIEERVGSGAMGAVYRARHVVTERPLALKLVETRGAEARARFLREARSLGRLRHPHIVQVHDAGEAGPERLYMALDYIEGQTLSQRLEKEGPFGLEELARVLTQILEAVGHAHRLGVVHRDLKGDNIMLEHIDGRLSVKVLDFGVAKLIEQDVCGGFQTIAGQLCGTPAYMSPEQAAGAEISPLSDMYSVGVLAYEMTTGRLPFQSTTSMGFLGQHMAQTPEPPRNHCPHLPEALEVWILRLLEKEPEDRFPAAPVALRALQEVFRSLQTGLSEPA